MNVERNGHTFQCDRLAAGESIVLSFNAYPKTLVQDKLTVTDVTYSYIQQGDTVSGKDTISVDTSGSIWFQYLTARENATVSWTLYAGILLIILAITLFGYQLSQKKKLQSVADSERKKMYALLEDVSRKLDLVQDNPSVRDDLKKRIDRELRSQEPVETPKISIRGSKPDSGQKKKSRFN